MTLQLWERSYRFFFFFFFFVLRLEVPVRGFQSCPASPSARRARLLERSTRSGAAHSDAARGGRDARRMTRDRSFDANAVGLRSRRAARSSDVTSFGHPSPTTRMRARTTPGTLVLGRAGSRAEAARRSHAGTRVARRPGGTSYAPLVDARVDDARGG